MGKRKKGIKPVDSKTVRQWALLGRTPLDGAIPSYIWDTFEGPSSIYYLEKDTRDMTQEEYTAFVVDMKGYSERFLKMFSQMAKENAAVITVDEDYIKEITDSEWKVIGLVSKGLSNKEIAAELFLTEGSVRNYLSSVLKKLDLRDRTQLAIWAVQWRKS